MRRHEGEEVETGQAEGSTGVAVPAQSLVAFYSSHALFMINNRSYEFASVLFTASAFPHTLVAASIRGLSAHLASVLISPAIGQWCGRHPSRLRPVQLCIVIQRLSLAVACLGWIVIINRDGGDFRNHQSRHRTKLPARTRNFAFVVLIVLGMIGRLAAVGNQIVVERDWVPMMSNEQQSASTAAAPCNRGKHVGTIALSENAPLLGSAQPRLHVLNAATKRIDLVAKLATPLVVSAVALGFADLCWVAVLLAAVQLVSCFLELSLTHQVWSAYPSLRAPKDGLAVCSPPGAVGEEGAVRGVQSEDSMTCGWSCIPLVALYRQLRKCSRCVRAYAASTVVLPSVAVAIEPFSVLTMAGSMSAYLLVAHYSLASVTMARTISTAVEFLSTIVTPLLITFFSRNAEDDPGGTGTVRTGDLVKVGVLGLSWQFLTLIPATGVLLFAPALGDLNSSPSHAVLTSVLCASMALSRLGPFAYSLVEQQIVQIELQEAERLEFSGVEMALGDLAELARWSMMGVFGDPGQFRWAAAASFASVGLSLILFVLWARKHISAS